MRLAALSLALAIATPATAQPGVSDTPCASLPSQPAEVAAYFAARVEAKANETEVAPPSKAALELYNDWQAKLRDSDFPNLCKYQADNAALPAPSNRRIVFIGDSITELWGLDVPELFTGDTINRGISGQTTEQMLVRFRADVIALKPKVVHILAGTNDIAGNTGPTSLAWIEANIETMVDLARAHGIAIVLAAIPPAAKFGWRPEIGPAVTIAAYNYWLRDYAARRHLVFVDYHAPLDDGRGGFAARLTTDGVHPNAAGYAVMTGRARQAIAQAVPGKKR